ncbi:uncharacterized protein TM35_000113410 [Trypanosoma theileri]|uniref:Uncharacterized protein n=1 Tax=Trypanosoma theileri TaxID=67003 RepID=A0A1X0NYQ3_9TRYP|nr:uncharacterized protein TM35_000113410 [Trypanosoma theileri]ORC89807.1 hypothetical protein TM35_000113410 [Trypanosoma theileri]
MDWMCLHDRPVVVRDGSTRPTCASTILALQAQQESLRAELAASRKLLAGAGHVLAGFPQLAAAHHRGLQRLLLLLHGVALETAAALLRAWGCDREALLDAHEQAVLAAAAEMYDAWQHAQWAEEEAEAQIREAERGIEVPRRVMEEKDQVGLLKKAAAVLERRWQMGKDASTNTVNVKNTISTGTQADVVKMAVVACQTVDTRSRTAAVQTTEELVSLQHHQPTRKNPSVTSDERKEWGEKQEEMEEIEPEPLTSVPLAFPAELSNETILPNKDSKPQQPKQEIQIQNCYDVVRLKELELEVQRLRLECKNEREMALATRLKYSVLENKLQEQSKEIVFLRSALNRIESSVFSSSTEVLPLNDTTPLEELALAGDSAFDYRSHALLPSLSYTNEAGEISAYYAQLHEELLAAIDFEVQRVVQQSSGVLDLSRGS